jgi:hypothetical protein
MANGGQVLIDSATFDVIKDHRDLAAVDHHGYNDTLLLHAAGALDPLSCGRCKCAGGHGSRVGGHAGLVACKQASLQKALPTSPLPASGHPPPIALLPCLIPVAPLPRAPRNLLPCRRRDDDPDAPSAGTSGAANLVILDMGEFDIPDIDVAAAHGGRRQQALHGAGSRKRLAAEGRSQGKGGGEGEGDASVTPSGGSKTNLMARRSLGSGAAAGGSKDGDGKDGSGKGGDGKGSASNEGGKEGGKEAGGKGGGDDSDAKPDSRLRVYSVLPQCLAERARAWGSCLALRDGVRQTDAGFFDAPGAAAAASLVPLSSALAGAAAPPVTVVFASVDGVRGLRRRAGGADVSGLLRAVLRAAIGAVPGAYLCREIDGSDEIKYMLAFPSATAALTFCLLVQEATMYAPWPQSVLDWGEWREVHAPGDGALLFRGPRLRMGVAEGVPRSLAPDCAGRADYYGPAVNLVGSGDFGEGVSAGQAAGGSVRALARNGARHLARRRPIMRLTPALPPLVPPCPHRNPQGGTLLGCGGARRADRVRRGARKGSVQVRRARPPACPGARRPTARPAYPCPLRPVRREGVCSPTPVPLPLPFPSSQRLAAGGPSRRGTRQPGRPAHLTSAAPQRRRRRPRSARQPLAPARPRQRALAARRRPAAARARRQRGRNAACVGVGRGGAARPWR